MARSRAFAALILALAACASPQSGGGPAATPGELEVTTELDAAGAPREGDLATILFRIRNGSKNPVILRELTQPRDLMLSGTTGAVASWQFSQPGLVTYVPERDEWIYEKGRRTDVPRPVFNSGLLVPTETITLRARVRLLEMPMDFQFTYFEIPPDDLRRKVYFETRGDKDLRYRALAGRELAAKLQPEKRPDAAGHRFVIFPHADPVRDNALLKTVRIQETLKRRSFGVEQAARLAGVERPRPGTYSFSTVFDAWILPKEAGHVLVTPTGLTPLPELRQMDRIFYLIDSTLPARLEADLRGDSIATTLQELKYAIVAHKRDVALAKDVKETRMSYYTFLSAEQLPKFFADLKKLKLSLDVEFVDGGGKLQVLNK